MLVLKALKRTSVFKSTSKHTHTHTKPTLNIAEPKQWLFMIPKGEKAAAATTTQRQKVRVKYKHSAEWNGGR